jgi:integrase
MTEYCAMPSKSSRQPAVLCSDRDTTWRDLGSPLGGRRPRRCPAIGSPSPRSCCVLGDPIDAEEQQRPCHRPRRRDGDEAPRTPSSPTRGKSRLGVGLSRTRLGGGKGERGAYPSAHFQPVFRTGCAASWYQSNPTPRLTSHTRDARAEGRVPVKVISETLGHESPAFTLKQYAYVIPGMQAEAAALIARLLSR